MKMAEITIGMKLEDSRTDEIFTVVEKNSKYKTVMIEGADGRTRNTALATITKHFTEVVDLDDLGTPGEAEPVVEEPVVDTVEVEEPEQVEEPEVVEEKKPKKRVKKRKVTALPFIL